MSLASPPSDRPVRSLRQRVAALLDGLETSASRRLNVAIALVTLASSATFVLETFPAAAVWMPVLNEVDRAFVAVFAVEYLLRLWCAEQPAKFVLSLYSIIDLLAIAPLLVAGWDGRYIRILRWFRILRLVRFFNRKYIPGNLARDDVLIFARILFTLFSLLFVYAGLIYQVEHPTNPAVFDTFLSAFYFAVATMTTVGFGDITPITEIGRLLTVFMILSGVVLIPWQVGELVRYLAESAAANVGVNLRQSLRDKIRRAAKELARSPAPPREPAGDSPPSEATAGPRLILDGPEVRGIPNRDRTCDRCGLSPHDVDARYCKRCGEVL